MKILAAPLALTSLMQLTSAATAQVQIGLSAGGYFGGYSLSHDSSGVAPSLGAPTSVLEYSGLIGPSLDISFGNSMLQPNFFALSASYSQIVGGTLRDTDYAKGQVVTSDTFSSIVGNQTALKVRVAPELLPTWHTNYGAVRLFVTGSFGKGQIDALGLRCGISCSAPMVADDLAVIQQSHVTYDAGLGLAWETQFSYQTRLELMGSVSLGRAHIDDSHTQRADLGPTPNVIYRFATVKPSFAAEFRHALTPTLNMTMNGQIDITYGDGTLTLGPQSNKPYYDLPARFQSLSSFLSVGIRGQF